VCGGDLQREPGLADPAGADQGHQPAGGVVEQLAQAGQLPLPADQRGERQGQVRRGGRLPRGRRGAGVAFRRARFVLVAPPGGHRRPGAQPGEPPRAGDLLAQGDGGRRRLGTQLLLEHVPAGLVLGQGGAASAAGGQEPHKRAVRLLLERLKLQHAAGGLDPGGRVPPVAGQPDGAVQQRQHVGPDGGTPPDQPLVEQRGARNFEALQELAAAQPHGRQQLATVPLAGGHAGHLDCVNPDGPAAGKRHRLPGHLQMVREDAAQLG